MAAASLASAALAVAAAGRANAAEVLLGMIAPLLAACVSWVLTERTYRRDPPALTGVMTAAFAVISLSALAQPAANRAPKRAKEANRRCMFRKR